MHLHCRFYLKTDSDSHLHCQFYLKTDGDVYAALYKINCRPHTSILPTHELSQSHFPCFTLTSQEIHSLSTWFGHGSCIFQWYWYVVFSNILSIFILSIFICMFLCILHLYIFLFLAFDLYLIMLPHFTWKIVLCIYFMFIYFFVFYRSGGMNNRPPPPQEPGFRPGDEPFAPNVAIPRFPVPAIVWNIFQHLLFFYANK